MITKDQYILKSLQGFQIPFLELPVQIKEPKPLNFSIREQIAIDLKIFNMVEAKVI